jgi:hypothetical protein
LIPFAVGGNDGKEDSEYREATESHQRFRLAFESNTRETNQQPWLCKKKKTLCHVIVGPYVSDTSSQEVPNDDKHIHVIRVCFPVSPSVDTAHFTAAG